MGAVADHLVKLIERQVLRHHLVVWFDPGGQYREIADMLELADTRVARYEGSYFALRHQVDGLLDDDLAPKLVVYVPLDQEVTQDGLVELTAAGVVMRPGQQPRDRNTRLAVVVRGALEQTLSTEQVDQVVAQVERGALGLADVERLLDHGLMQELGPIVLLFGVATLQEVALAFLTSEAQDEHLVARGLLPQLAHALGDALGAEMKGDAPAAVRAQLARLLLARELVDPLEESAPEPLRRFASPGKGVRETSARLVSSWRNRRDLQQAYAEAAARVEAELRLADLELSAEQLRAADTFRGVDVRLQAEVEAELLHEPSAELVARAEQGVAGFWAQHDSSHLARWATIAAAGQVLLEAERVGREARTPGLGASALARRYAEGEQPWCLLDTAHRRLERLYVGFELDAEGTHGRLEQVVARARQAYADAIDILAERFTRTLVEARYELAGLTRQRDVFGRFVRPALDQGKTAYVLVDALRFEMARELAQGLADDFAVELDVAVATVPTITEVGMAALMPGMDERPTLVEASRGKLGLEPVPGWVLRTRADRLKWLDEHVQGQVMSKSLETFSPPNKATRDQVKAADLVVLWSQEIDELSEGGNVPMARLVMEAALASLRRAYRALASLGVQTIVVSADHGYLFGDEPESGMTIDPPGGMEVDRHRRVWIGKGGAAEPGTLRARADDFELGGNLEIVTPWNTAVFRANGARAYFHGGLSPQELLIPVLRLRPRRPTPAHLAARIAWRFEFGSQRITTRFFTITVTGTSKEVLELVPPRVRLELRVDGKLVSTLVAASYGYDAASQEVQLRRRTDDERSLESCSVTLQLDLPDRGSAVAILFDVQTGLELVRSGSLPVKVSI